MIWIEPEPVDVPAPLRDAVSGSDLVAKTLVRRGITTPVAARAFLDPDAYTPADPADLPDLATAAERLKQAIRQGEQIVVWGDFDADGQTSTAVLLETLQALTAAGAQPGSAPTFHIPTRQEGHGVHVEGIAKLIADGARLIVTCDTGVTAHAAVAQANRLGAEVIVTDHHVPGRDLPPALAVVNPHRLPEGHPMATLPGVGVAYQLARALAPDAAERAWDLVALGTVADVATLTGDARYLVQRGLDALRRTDRLGLQTVYQLADLNPAGITEEHIGFVLAPRLNALGRLADASAGVALLTTGDPTRARLLASEVEGLNARRRWLTKQVTDAALAQIERDPALLRDYPVLVLSHPTWPGGVLGIVAGRLAERFGRPAVLISAPTGKTARGSGRSVPGVDLIASLTDCAPLLDSFGGHRGAAGFALDSERIDELRRALSRAVAARTETIPEPTLTIDAYLHLGDITPDLVAEIDRLAPFGPGNPPLTFVVRDLRLLSEVNIGITQEHRRLTVEDAEGHTQTVFWWQGAGWPLPRGPFDLALTVRANDYRGLAEVQVEWLDARLLEPLEVETDLAKPLTVHDYRTVGDPLAIVADLVAGQEAQVWAEAGSPPGIASQGRHELGPAPLLVIWTLPPGPDLLLAALERARPQEVALFARQPEMGGPPDLPQRPVAWAAAMLAGMARFALEQRDGWIDLERAAARVAQRTSLVQAGLEWLAAQGKLAIVQRLDGRWQLAREGAQADPEKADLVQQRVEAIMAETEAYREYASGAPAASLLPGYQVHEATSQSIAGG
jgi:single-stranded-DNA-specific exonuclease